MAKTRVTGPLTNEAINTLTRSCLTAPPGFALAVCDFSQVEARGLQWAAGDHEGLKVFHLFDSGDKVNGDPYRAMAAKIYGRTPAEIGKESIERKVGKIAELACLAGDTPVLTSRGAVPITSVCDTDLLWDGQEWVSHQGLVFRGFRKTLSLSSVGITPDHLILCGDQWAEAESVSGPTHRLALATALESLPLSRLSSAHAAALLRSWCGARAEATPTESSPSTYAPAALLAATSAQSERLAEPSNTTGGTPRSYPTTDTAGGCLTASPQSSNGARTPAIETTPRTAGAVYGCGPDGCATAPTFCGTSSLCPGGTCPSTTLIEPTTIEGTSPAICASCRGSSTSSTSDGCARLRLESPILRPVYDLAHAGPRNRFTILTSEGPLIVHNCGYGQGAGGECHPKTGKPYGFHGFSTAMGADWNALAPLTPKSVVAKWREIHEPIVSYWKELEQAATMAVNGVDCAAGPFEYLNCDGLIVCRLPSGRPLVYRGMKISRDERGRPGLSYMSRESARRGIPERTYGGKLAENCIQAMCRDLMAVALVKAEAEGLAPCLTIHDEIICQVPAGEAKAALALLHQIMCETPPWAAGMPIAAAGHVCERYHK